MPDNVTTLIAEIAVGFVAGGIVVRLLMAPYLIWKADQAIIADLRRELADPARQRREAFESSIIQARADFAIEMRKYLYGYNPEYIVINFNNEVLEHLNNHALLFAHDSEFSDMWRVFVDGFTRQASVLKINLHMPDPDGFIEAQVNRNLNFYFQLRREAAKAIIAYLTYQGTGKSDLFNEIASLNKSFEEIGRVDFYDQSSLDVVLARRLQSELGLEKPQ